MKILLANPRGFCAGVNMAIESLDRALELFGTPIFVYHEIVHNRPVVDRFKAKGVIFVDSIEEIPNGSTVLYSAHGVSPKIREAALARNLRAIDATCPLVTKVHVEAIKFAREGYNILLIGHEGHDEVIGTMGEAPASITLVQTVHEVAGLAFHPEDKLAYLTQTTLSVDEAQEIIVALKKRFPHIDAPKKEDICYATQNRQEAVRELVGEADLVLVLGSKNSSNSNRLAELGTTNGKRSFLVDGASEILEEWFEGVNTVLITAGASAPEDVVLGCVEHIRKKYHATVENRVIREENVNFALPRELTVLAKR
ncbi:MAG: 4-hydroxy-3-methylbut-2-enyl diphosphate reductase [Gemmataceae bacterium]